MTWTQFGFLFFAVIVIPWVWWVLLGWWDKAFQETFGDVGKA